MNQVKDNHSRKRSKLKDLKLFNLASNEELKEYRTQRCRRLGSYS